jgi:glutathione S-transferase
MVLGEITEAELTEARAAIEGLLEFHEQILNPGPWIVGTEFTLADITIAPYMFRLSALGAESVLVERSRSASSRLVSAAIR